MFIKQVIIEGFRSYREQTVIEPFSPRHNVIVGRNGCGKSNFFKAIQFVLSDEYTNLKEEDRIALLHEGSGPKVMSGFVEIIFDNSDGRLPIDKDEVAIKRAIGMKKDQYFLDKKVVIKADILNFLETAGFSRNNPYYIVKQGKINEISIAKDSFRLKILKEVAGSNVYDEKKAESSLILKETEDKRQSIVDVLKAIEDRLTQLEVEKEELKEFQKWDKMKRSIEYTIHNKELAQTQSKLNELQKLRSESSNQSSELYERMNTLAEQAKCVEKLMRDLKSREQLLKEELEQVSNERSGFLTRRARFEFDIKDAEDEARQAQIASDLAAHELHRVNELISETEKRLSVIRPEYDTLRQQEAQLTAERDMNDQKRSEIYAKQGRSTRFSSKADRDKWIRNELKIITKAIEDKRTLGDKLKQELADETKRCEQFRLEMAAITRRSDEQQTAIDDSEREHFALLRSKDELQTRRNELWRHETQLTQETSSMRDEQQRCEQSLRSITGRTLLQGIESIHHLIQQFQAEKKNLDLVDGYHGLLIDNIECEPSFFTAVESSVQSRLFYHIVDTDLIAMRLLKHMNQQKLHGEVNYFPLNQLRVEDQHALRYPETTDAVPLIKKIKYQAKVERAVHHVFDRILLCKNAEVAKTLAKQTQMDCVLLDGDLTSRKGTLTGGYVDTRQSKLAYYRQKLDIVGQLKSKEAEMGKIQAEIRQVDTQLNNVLNDLQKHETRGKRNRDTYEQMRSDLQSRRAEIERYEHQWPQKQRSVASLDSDIGQLESKKDMLNAELGTELIQQLSVEEQQVVDELNDKVHQLNQTLKSVLDRRVSIETEKLQLDNQLHNNLMKRREDLQQQLSANKMQTRSSKIDLYKSELALVNERVGQVESKLKTLTGQIDSLTRAEMVKYQKELDRLQDEERKIQDELQESTVDLEKVSSKVSLLLKKKDECLKATRNLGVLPQDAYDKYQDMTMKELYFKLDHCNQELKKLSHVNKKAMDQFLQFSEHKEKLIQRRDEADRAYKSILEFISTLDQRKNENMQMTFKQVSKYFNEIFYKLVPQGTAHLVMRKHDNFEEEDRARGAGESQQTDDSAASAATVEEYTGVGIRVSFAGKSNEMKDIQQLSGGQKSLVALGLIFAIQRCDPAPFYLFDEIDQALDPQYRKSVADMIHELAEKAQFITTTFRPELLEHADKFYGVRFRNKISIVDCVTKEEAFDFVEDDQSHK